MRSCVPCFHIIPYQLLIKALSCRTFALGMSSAFETAKQLASSQKDSLGLSRADIIALIGKSALELAMKNVGKYMNFIVSVCIL